MDTTLYNSLWELLAPVGEFLYRDRACRRLWDTFSPAKRQEIFDRIRTKKQRGEFVNPNPYFAIVNNIDDQAPAAQPPTNYYGRVLPSGNTYYRADYLGSRGLYTEQDVLTHHMSNPELFIQT